MCTWLSLTQYTRVGGNENRLICFYWQGKEGKGRKGKMSGACEV